MKEIKLFRKNDIIIIGVVILLGFIMMLPSLFNNNNLKATIYSNGKIIDEIELDKVENSYTFSPDSNPETLISVEKGRIRFFHAECKDKLCVNSGWLDSNGQTAACLPAKVVISITGSDNQIDAMTY